MTIHAFFKVKNYPLFLLACQYLFGFSELSAQSSFFSGFAVVDQRDTLYGEFSIPENKKIPETISWRSSQAGAIELLQSNSLSEINAGDFHFYRREVEIEYSAGMPAPDSDPGYKIKKDTLFLRVIVKGAFPLLSGDTANGKALFYVKKGAKFDLLKHKFYDTDPGPGVKPAEKSDFKRQLALAFFDCEKSRLILESIQYTEKSLVKSVNSLNSCGQDTEEVAELAEGIIFSKGFVASFVHVQPFLRGTDTGIFKDAQMASELVPEIGTFTEFRFPDNNYRWSVRADLTFKRIHFQSISDQKERLSQDRFRYIVDVADSYVVLSPTVISNEKLSGIPFFWLVGFSVSRAVASRNSVTYFDLENGTSRPSSDYSDKGVVMYGGHAGLGANIKRVQLIARYDFVQMEHFVASSVRRRPPFLMNQFRVAFGVKI